MMRPRSTLLLASVLVCGCDKPASQFPEGPPASRPDALPPPPTTQQLLEGPRTTMSLETVPASASVPEGWKIQRIDGDSVVFLAGLAPHGEVMLRPARVTQFTPQTLELYLQNQRKLYPADKPSVLRFDIREQNGFRVLEIVTAEANEIVDWRLMLMVNTGVNYEQYKVGFVGLNRTIYEADKAFLDSILKSVAYSPTLPGK